MKVLVVDDDMDSRALAVEALRDVGCESRAFSGAKEALAHLEREPYDLILSDIRMHESTGFDLLWVVRQRHPELPVVLMTAFPSLETAVESEKKGAWEYLNKPIQAAELKRILDRWALKHQPPARPPAHAPEKTVMVGRSAAMIQIYKTIARAAQTLSPVLVEGETGTGKELVVRALHESGPRAAQAFVEVNCAAIPETLIESEFFGHAKGAFTGAQAEHAGLFEQANGGTLFLDEIGHVPRTMQAKLLKAIEHKVIRRVGGSSSVSVDIRFVSATSRPLSDLISQGLFLEELFYRLNTVVIRLPALRERRDDILLIARHFLQEYAPAAHRGLDFSEGAIASLLNHNWPGNVRELQQVVRRAAEFTNSRFITAEDLKLGVSERGLSEMKTLAAVEMEYIQRVLEFTRGNRQRAADILGIDRKTLFRKLGVQATEPEDA